MAESRRPPGGLGAPQRPELVWLGSLCTTVVEMRIVETAVAPDEGACARVAGGEATNRTGFGDAGPYHRAATERIVQTSEVRMLDIEPHATRRPEVSAIHFHACVPASFVNRCLGIVENNSQFARFRQDPSKRFTMSAIFSDYKSKVGMMPGLGSAGRISKSTQRTAAIGAVLATPCFGRAAAQRQEP